MGFQQLYEMMIDAGFTTEEAMDEVHFRASDCLRDYIHQERFGGNDYWANL